MSASKTFQVPHILINAELMHEPTAEEHCYHSILNDMQSKIPSRDHAKGEVGDGFILPSHCFALLSMPPPLVG